MVQNISEGGRQGGNYGHKQFKTNTECALCFVPEPDVVVVVVEVPLYFCWIPLSLTNSIRRQYY